MGSNYISVLNEPHAAQARCGPTSERQRDLCEKVKILLYLCAARRYLVIFCQCLWKLWTKVFAHPLP